MGIHIGILNNLKNKSEFIDRAFINHEDVEIIFTTDKVNHCLELLECEENTIDILIWICSLSAKDDMDIIQYMKEHYFHFKIICVLSDSNYLVFSKSMDVGVDGLLLDNPDFSFLLNALKQVARGITYIDYRLHRLYQRYQDKTFVVECKLTPREKEVISCVAAGMFNKEIAYCLRIREDTVKNHLSNIYRKFHVNDRTEAVVYAVKHDLIDL